MTECPHGIEHVCDHRCTGSESTLRLLEIRIRMARRVDDVPRNKFWDKLDHVAQLRCSRNVSDLIEVVSAIACLNI